MYKIRKIKFQNHPILGDLNLNFCDLNGNAVDTVILAGENGCGKSTILNELYKFATYKIDTPIIVELEKDGKHFELTYFLKISSFDKLEYMAVRDEYSNEHHINSDRFKQEYKFSGIYSDVDINFNASKISSVTSLNLDTISDSRRSTEQLSTEINHLLIDIQALDDAEIGIAWRKNHNLTKDNISINEKMPRFTKAFNMMFENLKYDRIDNKDNYKSIIFKKFDKEITIDELSSGEKQIVYRGCFLLKDVNSTKGAFVFIDEPEISMHPKWQIKIMDYYKNIFSSENDAQTSQLFVATHSPFIIHNNNRKNDKVIVLSRDNQGKIIVNDKPEYYNCNSLTVVEDAFNTSNLYTDKSTVYLEGRTDEKYFNKALLVYNYKVPFQFKWIGYLNNNGQEENTGKDALNKAFQFLVSSDLSKKNVCLFDCDTQKSEVNRNNVYIKTIPRYENSKRMKKGIENALVLDDVDVDSYYSYKKTEGDYGNDSTIVEFDKMRFCNDLCSMEDERLKNIFINLKKVIDELIEIFK